MADSKFTRYSSIQNGSQALRILVLLVLSVLSTAPQAFCHGALHEQIKAVTLEISRHTNDPALYLKRGELHRQHQDWKAAAEDYDRAEQLDPQLSAVMLCRGRLYYDWGRFDRAREALDEYLAVHPDSAEAWLVRARARVKLGENGPGAADYSKAIALTAEPQPDYYLEQAKALVDINKLEAALTCLDAGIQRLGALAVLEDAALTIEVTAGRYEQALGRIERILPRLSRKETWQVKQGEVLLLAGRPVQARASFEAALEAIKRLPPKVQDSQSMRELKARTLASLAGLENRAEPKSKAK